MPLNGSTYQDVPSPLPDGHVTTFHIPVAYVMGSIQVFINGLEQVRDTSYIQSNPSAGEFEFTDPPLVTDNLWVIATISGLVGTGRSPGSAYYLTPARYKTLGSGLKTYPDDFVLQAYIETASALANAYCSVPTGHDFRGGSVVREAHDWNIGNVYKPPSMKVWPYHRPIRFATKLDIDITKNQKISFTDPNSLYVDETLGYVEPVNLALTTYGVFGYGILPNIGLRTPVARLDYVYGWEFRATEEPLAAISGGLQASNQFWTDDEVTVFHNGDLMDPDTDYTVDRFEGLVTPSDPMSGTYHVSYTYPLPTAIARATALLVTELIGQAKLAGSGLQGLDQIRVEEIELRTARQRSGATGLVSGAPSPAAMILLDPYRIRSMA